MLMPGRNVLRKRSSTLDDSDKIIIYARKNDWQKWNYKSLIWLFKKYSSKSKISN